MQAAWPASRMSWLFQPSAAAARRARVCRRACNEAAWKVQDLGPQDTFIRKIIRSMQPIHGHGNDEFLLQPEMSFYFNRLGGLRALILSTGRLESLQPFNVSVRLSVRLSVRHNWKAFKTLKNNRKKAGPFSVSTAAAAIDR
jgi:hypothetical protein